MSVAIGPFLFGEIPEAELLKPPQGFRYIIRPESWVKAIGPDNRLWYVQKDRLTLQGKHPGSGQPFADTQTEIMLT